MAEGLRGFRNVEFHGLRELQTLFVFFFFGGGGGGGGGVAFCFGVLRFR